MGEAREAMSRDLMEVAVWISENPKTARKRMEPIRSAKVLKPGVYFNTGTGMVDRIYSPQRVALGHRMYRISKDSSARAADIKQKLTGGR